MSAFLTVFAIQSVCVRTCAAVEATIENIQMLLSFSCGFPPVTHSEALLIKM